MDALEIQRRRKQEQKGKRNSHNDYDVEESLAWGMFAGLILGGFMLAGIAIYSSGKDHKDALNECESIGGKYEVVDRQSGFRSVIDVYGCVK